MSGPVSGTLPAKKCTGSPSGLPDTLCTPHEQEALLILYHDGRFELTNEVKCELSSGCATNYSPALHRFPQRRNNPSAHKFPKVLLRPVHARLSNTQNSLTVCMAENKILLHRVAWASVLVKAKCFG